jgi:hypothetical protein
LLPNMWQEVTLKVGKEVSQFWLCYLYTCSIGLIVAVTLKRMNPVERSIFIEDTTGSIAWCNHIRRYDFFYLKVMSRANRVRHILEPGTW